MIDQQMVMMAIQFVMAAISGGAVVAAITEFLKADYIPDILSSKYPEITAAVLSLAFSAGYVFFQSGLVLSSITAWFSFAVLTLLISGGVYKMVLKSLSEKITKNKIE